MKIYENKEAAEKAIREFSEKLSEMQSDSDVYVEGMVGLTATYRGEGGNWETLFVS